MIEGPKHTLKEKKDCDSYIYIDPITQQRIPHMKHIGGDLVYDMTVGDSTVTQEDIPVQGGWTDYTGSGGVYARGQLMFAGVANTLQGTDADIKFGAKDFERTDRGNRSATHRTRQIKKYIKLG